MVGIAVASLLATLRLIRRDELTLVPDAEAMTVSA
jgi:hypothetical protein